jgi:hypothetical protein
MDEGTEERQYSAHFLGLRVSSDVTGGKKIVSANRGNSDL